MPILKDSYKTKVRKGLQCYFVGIVACLMLLCFVSWVLGIYIEGVESPFTSNGLRWIVGNMMTNFDSVPLAEIIFGLFGLSVIRESGIVKIFEGHVSLKQKRALQITIISMVVFALLFSLMLFLPNAILLSAFGDLNNSPLMKGLFGIIIIFLLLVGNVYGYTSGRFTNLNDFVSAHLYIFNTISPYFLILFFSSQFICCLEFTNILSFFGDEQAIISAMRLLMYYAPLATYVLLLL